MRPFILIFLLAFLNCTTKPNNDIYRKYPKGIKLNKDIVEKAEQFYKVNSELILVVNNSTDIEYYNAHLLFFNEDLELENATYFSSEKIEDIKNNFIYAFLNEEREKRRSAFINDAPDKYKIIYQIFEGGSGQKSNKIIDSIIIDSNKLNLVMFVRLSNDFYSGVNWDINKVNSINSQEYTKRDTLVFALSLLHFDFKNRRISFRENSLKNSLIWDNMIFTELKEFEKFYSNLIKAIYGFKMGLFDSPN